MQKFLRQLSPFLMAGLAIIAFAFGIVLFAYLFIFGAILGFVLYLISAIRDKFFPTKNIVVIKKKKSSGRIIDSDDWKEL